MRILYLAARLPDALVRGYEVRAFHHLRILGRRHRITLVAYTVGRPSPGAVERLRTFCAEVVTVPLGLGGMAAGLSRGFLAGRPIQTAIYETPAMRRTLERLLQERRHDLIHVQMPRMAGLLEDPGGVPRVVDLIDALSLNMARRRDRDRGITRWLSGLEAERLRRYEQSLCREWSGAVISSEVDRTAIGEFPNFVVSSNAVDLERFAFHAGPRDPAAIVFTGNLGYFPNVDGIVWFARQVLPRVRAGATQATLSIVGARPSRAVRRLAALGPHVSVVGPAAELAPHIVRASVAIAPLRAGSGQPLKVLEAMACGTPVVASRRAIDGLDVVPGEHLLVADDRETFARQVVALLGDPDAAARIARAARRLVEERYDWESAVRRLDDVYQSAARAP